MNSIDDQIDRLLRAARSPGAASNPSAPFGLETRVLAAWRGADHSDFWSTTLLVRSLLVAFAIMVLSFWPLLQENSSPAAEYLQQADSALQVSSNP